MLLKISLFVLLVLIVPYALGLLWKKVIPEDGIVFTYISGYLTLLAIFELVGLPLVLKRVDFSTQIIVYSIVLLAICGLVIGLNVFKKKCRKRRSYIQRKTTPTELILLIILMVSIAFQLHHTAFFNVGDLSSDDGSYVVFSSSAIYDNGFYFTDATSGMAQYTNYLKYALCESYVLYAYIAFITGIPVAVLEHTLLAVLYLLMAYGSVYVLTGIVFEKQAERLVFLTVLSGLYTFGMYSHYSTSFRMLGVIWQGKGFLTVMLQPLLLGVYYSFLKEDFRVKRCCYLVMISLAALSLTLGGIITMIVIPTVFTGLYFIKDRRWMNLLYLLSALVVPGTIGLYYQLFS